jgi:hypothetical protein
MLPQALVEDLRRHLERVKILHSEDIAKGRGDVWLPYALERKYKNANREWAWQYVFPSANFSFTPYDGKVRRHHVSTSPSQEAIEIEGAIDPKKPNFIVGTKTYMDELGNKVTISWSLRICK